MAGNVRKSRLGLYDQTTPLDRVSTAGGTGYGKNKGEPVSLGKNPAASAKFGAVKKQANPPKV